MIAQKVNPSQTHHFRTYLFGFFRYRKLDPDEDEYDDAVTKVPVTLSSATKIWELALSERLKEDLDQEL
ncbi:hypothetical protein E6H33_11105 [Candidatus Bathyarchaeota archaeon]|nr:MAG: hypothetical protein E6H33_11105 [Candidatus Bathyarchaeota archaeon]